MESTDNDVVRRPPILAAILDISNETESIDKEIFRKFLSLSESAYQQSNDSRLAINGSVRYRISTRALEGNHGENSDISSGNSNSSLLDIFQYYAALEPPNAMQAKTFSDVLETNDTMELVEFSTFLRDFRVVPRLVAKKDVREVWQSISADYVAAGKGTFKKMDFEWFKDAIVRLAITAFCKIGLRNLMMKVNGFSLSARHAVDYLCKYLHLEDQQWVINHIAVVGKESQGARNYRSEGEVDELAMRTLVEERQVARLEHRGKIAAQLEAKKKKKPLLKKPSLVQKFPSLVDSVHTNPAKSLLPDGLKQQLYPEFFGLQSLSVADDEDLDAIDLQASTTSAATVSESPFSGETDHPIDIIKRFHDTTLVKMLSKYCVAQEHQMCTRHIHSEGPFLDMGIVPIGARCQIRFLVTNKYRDSLYFDVRAREFECEDVLVRTQAAALIPGLPRVVDIFFTICRGDRSVVGFVDLYYLATGSTVESVISCPVYYRVGHPLVDTRILCTAHTLRSLLTSTSVEAVPKKPPSHLACTMTSPHSRVPRAVQITTSTSSAKQVVSTSAPALASTNQLNSSGSNSFINGPGISQKAAGVMVGTIAVALRTTSKATLVDAIL